MKENKINPTREQLDILEAVKHTRVLKVNAVAGSGKSSTLKMLAEENKVPSLYICFNKVNADEARTKFPHHTECRTTHSLAFPNYGQMLLDKLSRPSGKYVNVAGTSAEIARYYNIKNFPCKDTPVLSTTIAALVKMTVNRYQNSAEQTLDSKMLPMHDIKLLEKAHIGLDSKAIGRLLVQYAKKLWNDRINPSSPVLAHHDTYLKLYQLSKPVLSYDIIYVDEAQDLNPVTLDILQRQTQSKVIYVGDKYQSIYAFRGAVNALESICAPTTHLSQSFRYGQAIADVATWIIGGDIRILGSDIVSSVSMVDSKEYTMIFRTNGALLETAVHLIAQKKSIYCHIDTKGFVKKIESAQCLFLADHKGVKHEDITPFSCWNDLLEAAKEDPELKRIAKIVEDRKSGYYIKHLSDMANKPTKADIFLTTAHKSKGMEWDNVILGNDYPLTKDTNNPFEKMNQQEINLFYVAATRAVKTLQLPEAVMEDYLLSFEEEPIND